jgi:hypothetical protein
LRNSPPEEGEIPFIVHNSLIVVALPGEDGEIFVSAGRNPTQETGFFGESTGPKASFRKKNPVSRCPCVSAVCVGREQLLDYCQKWLKRLKFFVEKAA